MAAVAATAATLLLGVPAEYVLSREDVRGRSSLLTALLALQMVDNTLVLVNFNSDVGIRLSRNCSGLQEVVLVMLV